MRGIEATGTRVASVLLVALAMLAGAAGTARGLAHVIVDPPHGSLGGGDAFTVTVMYDGTGVVEGMRGYHVEIEFDNSLVYIVDENADIDEGDFLDDSGTTLFLHELPDEHSVVVDCVILGATGGATGIGELCSITFTGHLATSGTSPLAFVDVKLRDTDNDPIDCATADGELELSETPVEDVGWARIKALYR